ncbi:eIF-2-alpha kinase GCN2 isoform X1 [Lathyrus oleraceus]|uniref:non-specific serine/threonine protein kinase n=1 Tax=Pisum sativum TaxID=3888 RepID=A0A9D4VXF9_PEA|nr:eIF-2-alpha kinase GCN2 isoform X1 [Pisum sativum]KAI5390649.1 eukaryotic translation initiation factor 2-alpha kinase, variant 2 [Pisum sativum]
MGHSSNKKKRGGGGRRNKSRTPSKDHTSQFGNDGDNEQLSEEITALCSIFQEDCEIIPGSPAQIVIKIRPYSNDMGYEDVDVSAVLVVRCLPGYPFKCPKLQVTPETGLSQTDADKLLALLVDQANLNAREGRVMIFNLVEAAQEFLSRIEPIAKPTESKFLHKTREGIEELCPKDMASSNKNRSFVYGFVDLFSGYGESWNWGFGIDETAVKSSSIPSSKLDASTLRIETREKKSDCKENLFILQELPVKLDTVGEVSEESNNCLSLTRSSRSLVGESIGDDNEGEKEYLMVDEYTTEESKGISDSESTESLSSVSLPHHQASQIIEKDLIMVHLLRLSLASQGTLADSWPQLVTELYNSGIVSDSTRDMASKPLSLFNKTFDHIVKKQPALSKILQLGIPDLGGSNTIRHSSRYLNDFEELRPLGHGGFGHVVLCKNKLDGRQYAMKKIRLKDKTMTNRILREVATLSRLQHQHVVRYYQAWFETGVTDSYGDLAGDSRTPASSTFSYKGATSNDAIGRENQLESTYLYIQMEYCPLTLRQMFESYSHFDKELAWHLFRQIVEGLAHIHGQGIIHRDLTPSNIFFDARNDIKIGDFGLAKFLKLEQVDQDPAHLADTTGVSIDGTGQVGTYFYTAPEIEQGWPKIDEKADMYSLGVIFFELWHPFGTAMERHVVLSDLKQKAGLPPAWVAEFPEQEFLLRQLMSIGPSDRPSATELLKNAFPPRMESEFFDDMLRTMLKSEDRSIYDKVLNAIFDEEMLSSKHIHQVGRLESVEDNNSSIQHTDFVTQVRDDVLDVSKDIFRQHCAKHLEISPIRLLDDCPQFNRNAVKLLTHGGDMLELSHELRLPFVNWIISNQKSSFKRYEISHVYRRAVGHSSPNSYLQGDFDIIGGTSVLTEAEVIKVTKDIITCFFHEDSCDIHLNHADILGAIWSWTGVKVEHRLKVAELLSMMSSLRPQSSERKSKWVVIRRQLLQELGLVEAMVNRLQTVGLRFCGSADQALPRLRGALPSDKRTLKALDELSELVRLLRIWKIDKNVYIDALMPPNESYHRDLFFQVYLRKENSSGSLSEGVLLAVGGRYDYLLHQLRSSDYKGNPPTGVGTSLALETIIQNCSVPNRNEASINILVCSKGGGILVCSRGGGGLMVDRMELVSELWQENFKADFVPIPDPSLTEQYEYANEHDIKCLVIITDAGFSLTDSVKVRHLELKKEKNVERENLVKFLSDAMATQFRNPSIWI